MKIKFLLPFLLLCCACSPKGEAPWGGDETTADLAGMFAEPPMCYRPYVWWHWMGSNFSKEGITRDLEAMKEAGIAGATIFNLTSAVQESEAPIENNPWPDQTYRSEAYWDALAHAAAEADRLGLKIGLHNCPGYSTAGGPWITEEKGMKRVVLSHVDVQGGKKVRVQLPDPDLPSFKFYSPNEQKATWFRDIAVVAVPDRKGLSARDVMDLTAKTDASGLLDWDAPSGRWKVYRVAYAPTMAFPHPVPDDVWGKTLESDKMSSDIAAFHWDNVLEPVKEHLGQWIGKSLTHVLIDSYEAGDQNWTEGFKEEFMADHGYDPAPRFALKDADPDSEVSKAFDEDLKATVSRLFLEKGFMTARDKIHEAGLELYWEPYTGPFSTAKAVGLADLPMGEFWTYSTGRISGTIVDKAKENGQRIVGAEAFTGWPTNSHYTEDPAFLKKSADGTFVSGTNLLFLHHWVHQPFDDRFQPGMGMGWWGTHFGRNQTWFKPGKAFFTYLSRCQMMLRQGVLEDRSANWIHRKTSEADIYFAINQDEKPSSLALAAWDPSVKPEYWDPYSGKISYAPVQDKDDSVRVTLDPGASMFVVLNHGGKKGYKVSQSMTVKGETSRPVGDVWEVDFAPKVDNPFSINDFRLKDFKDSDDDRLKYFSGTATYKTKISVGKEDLAKGKRVVLDLGELNDLAEVSVGGKKVAVLWYPPFKADVTDFLKAGDNEVSVAVTNTWANRMIGDEQFEPDFEWGQDRGRDFGRAIKAFPDWFMKDEPRPSKGRKTFAIWTYFWKDSPLQPAGLTGPVNLVIQDVI